MDVQSPLPLAETSIRSVGPKVKPFPLIGRYPALLRIVQCCPAILAINWVFQGMRGMDGKELSFRLCVSTMIAGVIACLGVRLDVDTATSAATGWLLAHSVGFTLNGQFWVCARYCPAYRRDPRALDHFVAAAVSRLQATDWLDSALMIGSQGLGIGTRTDRSDIDLRLLFPAGILAWIRINLLMLQWRTAALLDRIPLDLFAYDHPGALARFNQNEPLLLIVDRAGQLLGRFPHRRWTSPS